MKGDFMSIQRFSRKEMQKIISEILDKDVQVLPIGNHELRRHLVYKVISDNYDFVFKYYYQKNFGNREIASLKALQGSTLHIPDLVSYGQFGDNREWMLTNYIKGSPLIKVFHHIPRNKQLELFMQMGTELSLIHNYKDFDFFGEWDEDCLAINDHVTFLDAFMDSTEKTFNTIRNKTLPNQELLQKGCQFIMDHKDVFLSVTKAHLTHLDYDPRNILVRKIQGEWHISAVLDFEQSKPWDKEADFVHLYLKHFYKDPELEVAFMKGYQLNSTLSPEFHEKLDIYMIHQCMNICTWAFNNAPQYYDQAFKVLKRLLSKS